MTADNLNWKQFRRMLRHLTSTQLLILTSLITLLPILVGMLLWSRMPEQIPVYLDKDLRPDAYVILPVAVFLPSLVLLVFHLIAFFVAKSRAEEKEQRLSVFRLELWVLPILSNLFSYMTYALAMGSQYAVSSYVQLLVGLLFAFIGSYLPKIKPNSAIGIRIPWTFSSRHNWRFTHRFSGYSWMIGGLILAFAAFLPGPFAEEITMGVLLALLLLPVGFSYGYYLRQKVKGEPLHRLPGLGKGSLAALAVLGVLAVILLVTGSLDYRFEEDHLTIRASYYDDFSVNYRDIESVDYSGTDVAGDRIGGFSNLRLQMGFYHDPETEHTYTRYTYARPKACVIVTLKDRQLVLSGKDQMQTQRLYEQLLEKTEN